MLSAICSLGPTFSIRNISHPAAQTLSHHYPATRTITCTSCTLRCSSHPDLKSVKSELSMLVESPEGNVTFKGTLADDARTFQGQVVYYDGRTIPMSGRRR
jgi:hypothetical protein